MKKMMKTLTALMLLLALAVAAMVPAGAESAFTFRNGITFGMTMDQVIASEPGHCEIDRERTHGPVDFMEAEYEFVTENGARADLTYLFVDEKLAAIRVDHDARRVNYDSLKAELTALYGEATALDLNALGNGIFAVDDDGRPEWGAEAFVNGDVMIVLERDGDDIDVTYLDMSAGYIL